MFCNIYNIGTIGFRFIGVGFLPMVASLIFPVFFQAIGKGVKSSLLTIVRTVVCFVPLGYAFSRFGLDWFWLTFPVAETITTIVDLLFYRSFLKQNDEAKILGAAINPPIRKIDWLVPW